MKQYFSIQGMHCASCEIVIEETLKHLPNVLSVNVSHTRGLVTIETKTGHTLTAEELTSSCKDCGAYTFQTHTPQQKTKQVTQQQTLPLWMTLGGVGVIILALYMILSRLGFFTFSPSVDNPSGLLGVFAIGLIAAFSSCAAIVGGLLTAVSIRHAERHPNASRLHKFRPHLLFNAGRLAGFIVLGALIGWIGQGLAISSTANGALVFLIGLIMIGFGVNLLRILPKGLPTPKPPKSLSRWIHRFSESEHPAVPFFLGAVTFFLPCGFTQSVQLYALTLGDPIQSATIMFIFALGTLPALLGIGVFTSVVTGRALTRFGQVAGALILVLGIANLQNGAALLDWRLPSLKAQETNIALPIQENGRQVINMNVTSYGTYEPNSLTVVEGVPVTWNIQGADFMGCGNTLILKAFGVATRLRSGPNTVTFTPTKTGRYTFSCSMGMIRGTMNVIPNNS